MSTVPFDPTPYLGDLNAPPASQPGLNVTANSPSSGSGVLNTFMADTVGVAWRAFAPTFGGTLVDPWTQGELIDQATNNYLAAGMDPTLARQQATSDVMQSVKTSPAADLSIGQVYQPYVSDFFNNLFKGDPNKPCGITNLGACVPSWVIWVGVAAVAVGVLWVVRPYVVGAEELTGH
jgi:hypothetical protein